MDRADDVIRLAGYPTVVDPGGRTGNNHDSGVFQLGVELLAVGFALGAHRYAVDGYNLALVAMLNRFVDQQLGITLVGRIKLVDVDVEHFAPILFGSLEQNVQVLGFVTGVFFGQAANDIGKFGADFKPFAGLWINNTLNNLVYKFDLNLVFIICPDALGGLDGFIFYDRVNINE